MTPAEHTARLTEPIRAALDWQSSLGAPSWTTAGKDVTAAREALSTLEAALAERDALIQELERIAGTGPHLLPDDTVCACLDATGERKVRIYELCQRCEALMERDDLADAETQLEAALQAISDYIDALDTEGLADDGPLREALAGVPPQGAATERTQE